MDSYRTEAYGQLSLVVFLNLLFTFFDQPMPEITLYCDNKAVVETVNRLLTRKRPDFPNDALRPSWDLLQSLRTYYRQHPTLAIGHILGHQDNNVPVDQLPLPARLNVRADALAGAFQTASNHTNQQGPMIPGTRCQLLIRGEVVASHQQKKLRDVRRTEAIRSYIQHKTGMSEDAFAAVDWPSHELAVNTSQLPQIFMVKFLHKWLPVGRQTHRYNDKQYSSRCPSCPEEDEGFIHFLTCPERREWHKKLKDALRQCMDANNTDPTLSDTLIDGLYHFLRSTEQPVPTFPRFAPLVAQQTSIGWSQLLFGRWSSEWTGQQLHYLTAQGITPTPHNHGPNWVRSLVHIIWSHCHEAWLTRNKALHGHDVETRRQARLSQAQYRIRALYTFKSRCTPTQQKTWFYRSLEVHFEQEPNPTQLERWIAINEGRIFTQHSTTTRLQQENQPTLFAYFPQVVPPQAEVPATAQA